MGRRHRDRKLIDHAKSIEVMKKSILVNSEDLNKNVSSKQGRSRGRITMKKKQRKQLIYVDEEDHDDEYDELHHSDDEDYYNDEKKKRDAVDDNLTTNQEDIVENDKDIYMQLYHLMLAEEEQISLAKMENSKENNLDPPKMKNNVMKKEDTNKSEDEEKDGDDNWTTISNNFILEVCGDEDSLAEDQRALSKNNNDEWSIVSDIPSVYSVVSDIPSVYSVDSEFLLTYSDALRFGQETNQKFFSIQEEEVQELQSPNEKSPDQSDHQSLLNDTHHDADFIREGVKYGRGGGVKFCKK